MKCLVSLKSCPRGLEVVCSASTAASIPVDSAREAACGRLEVQQPREAARPERQHAARAPAGLSAGPSITALRVHAR